jgi:hypothetical protein
MLALFITTFAWAEEKVPKVEVFGGFSLFTTTAFTKVAPQPAAGGGESSSSGSISAKSAFRFQASAAELQTKACGGESYRRKMISPFIGHLANAPQEGPQRGRPHNGCAW